MSNFYFNLVRVSISRNLIFPGSFSEVPSPNLEYENCLDRKMNPKTVGFSKLLFISDKNHDFSGNFCVRNRKIGNSRFNTPVRLPCLFYYVDLDFIIFVFIMKSSFDCYLVLNVIVVFVF